MTLIVQIVLGLAILVGLVTIIMSSKNWHWSQLVLVLFIFFSAIGVLFLGAEVLRIHKNLRAGIPRLESQITSVEQQIADLRDGTGDTPGIMELEHQLGILSRERGRVWRGVLPAGQVSPQGQVAVKIEKPQPHGLEQDAIIYAFQAGEPNLSDPAAGAEFLGEFRVSEVSDDGVTLDPVLLIHNVQRIAEADGPWSLYETMPIDRHRLFAAFTPEQLQNMLPAASVEEYVRHGTPAEPDDDQWHVIGLDENGQRVGPENMDQAVKKLYDRTLRDYAFLFGELAVEKVETIAKAAAIAQDIEKLKIALASAEETGQFRQQQIDATNKDLSAMKADLAAIQEHRDAVVSQLEHFRDSITAYREANTALARQLTEQQMGMVRYINQSAPAPPASLLSP